MSLHINVPGPAQPAGPEGRDLGSGGKCLLVVMSTVWGVYLIEIQL